MLPSVYWITDDGRTMKLHLAIDIPTETYATEVQSFLASVRFVLKGIFPGSKIRVTVESEKAPLCKPATRESIPPLPN